jgi:hypothetical protein
MRGWREWLFQLRFRHRDSNDDYRVRSRTSRNFPTRREPQRYAAKQDSEPRQRRPLTKSAPKQPLEQTAGFHARDIRKHAQSDTRKRRLIRNFLPHRFESRLAFPDFVSQRLASHTRSQVLLHAPPIGFVEVSFDMQGNEPLHFMTGHHGLLSCGR